MLKSVQGLKSSFILLTKYLAADFKWKQINILPKVLSLENAIFEPSFQKTFGSQFRLNFRGDRKSVAFFGLRFSLRRLIKRSRAPDRAIEKSPLSFPPSFHGAFVPPFRAIKRTRRRRLHSAKRRERKRERKSRHLSSYFPCGRLLEPEQGFPKTFSKAGAWCEARFFQPCWARPIKSAPPFYEVSKSHSSSFLFFTIPREG